MRNRLERGKLHKAERGELILTVPCGYLKLPHGEVILDPDEQVCATVQLVFAKFAELGSFGKVYRYLRQNKILIGLPRPPRSSTWRVSLAARVACPAGPDVASSDLRGCLFLRPPPCRSQADGGQRRQGPDAVRADGGLEGAAA